MPRVIVKMYAGRAEFQKKALAEEITRAVIKTRGYGDDADSVSIEDVPPADWTEMAYRTDIADKPEQVTKSPATILLRC